MQFYELFLLPLTAFKKSGGLVIGKLVIGYWEIGYWGI